MFEPGMTVKARYDIRQVPDGYWARKGDLLLILKRSVHYPERDWAVRNNVGEVFAVFNYQLEYAVADSDQE